MRTSNSSAAFEETLVEADCLARPAAVALCLLVSCSPSEHAISTPNTKPDKFMSLRGACDDPGEHSPRVARSSRSSFQHTMCMW
jgi:hypothetical protein